MRSRAQATPASSAAPSSSSSPTSVNTERLWSASECTSSSSAGPDSASAIASIVALLLVVLLQYTQNRDTRALQLKLDEVIRALDAARTELLGLERLTDEELDTIEADLAQAREGQHRN